MTKRIGTTRKREDCVMSNKLLSEQELREQIEAFCLKFEGIEPEEDTVNSLVWLFDEQKIAWADMVINTSPVIRPTTEDPWTRGVEGLREAQSQRNNLNATSGEEK